MWTSQHRLYTNEAQTELLSEHDDDARLLCGEWDTIPRDVAERLGLVDPDGTTHSPLSIKRRQKREAAKEGDE